MGRPAASEFQMDMWLSILIVAVGAALAYGYWSHRQESRRLSQIFGALASRYGGEVRPASAIALPQLRFKAEGARWLVGAMATDGTEGGAAFTFVEVELPIDIALPENWKQALGEDELGAAKIRVQGKMIRVHTDAVASTQSEVEELIAVARRVIDARSR